MNFLYIPATRLLVAAGQERQVAALLAVSFLLNLIANLILIPRYGILGSAIARSLSITVYFILCEFLVNRSLILTGSLAYFLRILAPVGPMALVMVALYPLSPILSAAAGIAVYLILLLLTKGIEVAHLMGVIGEYRRALADLRGARGRPEG
jgi:O-antigen/teichoic acid export membrane protein